MIYRYSNLPQVVTDTRLSRQRKRGMKQVCTAEILEGILSALTTSKNKMTLSLALQWMANKDMIIGLGLTIKKLRTPGFGLMDVQPPGQTGMK